MLQQHTLFDLNQKSFLPTNAIILDRRFADEKYI